MSKENKEKPKIKIEQRTLRGEIAKWQTNKEETPKEDIKELEAEADLEDFEFKKWEEKYTDAKYNLEEFIDFIKNHNLEAGQEEAVKDLKARLAELRNLLKNKSYENFKIKHNEFDDILESLYPPTPLEEKKESPKRNKTVGEQKIAQERGKALHKKNQERFNELVRSIKLVDAKKNQKGKFFNSFQKQLDILYISLQNDAKLDDPKEFAANVKLFNDIYKQAEERVEKERAETENVTDETATTPPRAETPDVPAEKKDVFGKDITRLKSVDLKLKSAPTRKLSPEPDRAMPETVPAREQPTIQSPQPEPRKKGLWGRFKDGVGAVFNRDTGKAAAKMGYDSITFVLGIKLATDMLRAIEGKGDIVEWWKGRKESQEIKNELSVAYREIMEALDKNKINKDLAEIDTRIENFKAKVESAKILPEVKEALLKRVAAIVDKHHEDANSAREERDAEVQRVLDAYVQGKISGMKIAKDAANFALTASGFIMLRGIMYAGVSIVERVGKARKEYVKRGLKDNSQKTELAFVAKDVLVNAALETARALTLRGEKKGANKKTKTIDFIKAVGTVARGFGIYGLAFSHAELPGQSIDKLISGIKEQGVAATVSDNFIHNAERAYNLYTHPIAAFQSHKVSPALESNVAHEIQIVPEHPPAIEHHEAPVPAEAVADINKTVAVEVLNNREGILSGVNKIIHNHQDVFVHDDGKPWSANEIHLWKVNELKEMGFKFEGGKWGYPMTVHAGAQVEVFTDEQGQPHFKLASDEHVTFNKNYKWVDTEHHPAKTGTVESLSNDDLINPYPDSHEIKTNIESVVDHAQIAPADMAVEHAAMPKSVRVDANIKEMAVVHHAPTKESAAAQEVMAGEKTASQFLTERGSNPKEFIAVYDKMVDGAIDRLKDSLIFRGGADKFLQSKINALYNTEIIREDISKIEKVLDAEIKFKFNQPDWLKTFRHALFDKSDKGIQLALLPDRDVLLEPIKTNGGHAARIWDEVEGKDVFIYNKDHIFNTNEDGRLIVENERGKIKLFNQKQALKMSEKELF